MSGLALIFAVVLVSMQRLLELRISRRNERKLRVKGAVERGAKHYPAMVAIHILWLVSMLAEGLLRGPDVPVWWLVPLLLFLAVQPLRYWAIHSLGENWNVRILVVPGRKLVRRGTYRYFPHPNYVVVAVEVLTLPLIFGAWTTALVFTVLNSAFFYVRIREEERALREIAG
ncbi:MAG: isoprenylcysteine carboxyl methyltransferase family protein [Rubrobacteraceae bacterium]